MDLFQVRKHHLLRFLFVLVLDRFIDLLMIEPNLFTKDIRFKFHDMRDRLGKDRQDRANQGIGVTFYELLMKVKITVIGIRLVLLIC